jgi:hypothetical protein
MGKVTLAAKQSRALHAGQRGTVVLERYRGAFGQELVSRVRDYIRRRMQAVR